MMKKVVILSAEVARKIAAGEVIDRPNAVVRELLDNAVDSGATSITCEISGGGIDKIRIIDNGSGMTKDDLQLCCEPHATSKISTEADLLTLNTLGFRGEALTSIAAVSRLTIQTADLESGYSWILENSITEKNIKQGNLAKGTIVESCGIFENFPARRQFLKRPASELAMCRQTFIEKALPRNDIAFRFIVDDKIRHDLPITKNKAQRVVDALELQENVELFYELTGKDADNWNYSLIIGESGVNRKDKKNIYIFVNGRKINEYALVQAIEYGAEGFFPNGTHPVACLFLNVKSSLVDFNIHPAKREARFKDIAPIHRSISTAVKTFFRSHALNAFQHNKISDEELNSNQIAQNLFDDINESYGTTLARNIFAKKTDSFEYQKEIQQSHLYDEYDIRPFSKNYAEDKSSDYTTTCQWQNENYAKKTIEENYNIEQNKISHENFDSNIQDYDFVYLGMTLGTFLLAEYDNKLFVIDQHAAHERILFNELKKSAGQKQNLLIPYYLETESSSDDDYLESIKDELNKAGFEITNQGKGIWEIDTVPVMWQGNKKDLEDAILKNRKAPEEILRHILALTACRAALKDGHVLDRNAACKIIDQTLKLDEPYCPHGRPVWIFFDKSQLFDLVKRT